MSLRVLREQPFIIGRGTSRTGRLRSELVASFGTFHPITYSVSNDWSRRNRPFKPPGRHSLLRLGMDRLPTGSFRGAEQRQLPFLKIGRELQLPTQFSPFAARLRTTASENSVRFNQPDRIEPRS
jgi:hypothetical protein